MGGLRTAARRLFPGWDCRPGRRMAPHRRDAAPYIELRKDADSGAWGYKDWATRDTGGLLEFVMLYGKTAEQAAQWLIYEAFREDEPPTGPVPMQPALSTCGIAPAPASPDGYPSPMADDAFHGIAGEIVRLIEPHTEADPAALLFQFLAAFGNMIGRNAHMTADGARHCLNLFGVLVGQSSKGRKGTSWNQVAALLENMDADWRARRVTSGLSSGEGLIWHVRDAVTAPPGDGKSRLVVLDPGVPDKRLMVVEGEFANALKVMNREMNTLSPVIRAAWDSGALRTLTKNSPVTATGAHISIIGHITRDELRRFLGEIESANGFANRFCWLAVRRSKCLPDGGRIDTVDFKPVLARLRDAVAFASTPRELTRDKDARLLWHDIYPQLSGGRPGLLGAVTGRAEAQVMRLGALYALLDSSPLIRPGHHHAALAVWGYCEQSARWIFGTATGDKNADKILAALRQAASAGMTRSEISEKVFLRNVSKPELSDALAVLQQAGMAEMKREMHGSAVCERWVARDE